MARPRKATYIDTGCADLMLSVNLVTRGSGGFVWKTHAHRYSMMRCELGELHRRRRAVHTGILPDRFTTVPSREAR